MASDPTRIITAASTDVDLETLARRLNISVSALKQRCISRHVDYVWRHGKGWIPQSQVEIVDYSHILEGRLVDVVDVVDVEAAPALAPSRELVTFEPSPEKPKPTAPSPTKKNGAPPTPGESRTVTLTSGGSITLATDVRILDLSPDDRAFLFDLVDRIVAYGRLV